MLAVETQGLCKTYLSHKKAPGIVGGIKALFTREKTEVKAVRDVTMSIQEGELVGFLGPNGAGKTTTLKMLTGILHPTSGTASVLGYTPHLRNHDMLRRLSLVMGNKNQLWWDLPAWDSFVVLREIYEVDHAKFKQRVDRLLVELQLTNKIHTQVRKLSLGERMKCELVAALLHSPEVVFLDEPTIGLDVVSQKRIRDFLQDIHREDGCTILLTSHYMQDVEALCDRVIVIDHGTIVFDGTLKTLSGQYSHVRRLRLTFSEPVSREDLNRFGTIVEATEETAVIDVPQSEIALATSSALTNLPVMDVAVEDVDIEDIVRELFSSTSGN